MQCRSRVRITLTSINFSNKSIVGTQGNSQSADASAGQKR